MTNEGPRDIVKNQKDFSQINSWGGQKNWSVSAESPLPDCRLLTSGCTSQDRKRTGEPSEASFIQFIKAPPSPPNLLPKTPSQYHYIGVRFWTYELGEHRHSVHCTGLDLPWTPDSHLSLEPGSLAISPCLWSRSHPSGQTWFLLCSTNDPIGSAPNKLKRLTKQD